MATERHNVAFVVGAVIGGFAGAAYGLWNAPDSGERTRRKLEAQARFLWQQVTDTSSRLATDTQQQAERLIGDTQQRAQQLALRVSQSLGGLPPEARPATAPNIVHLPIPGAPAPVSGPPEAQPTDIVLEGPRPAPERPSS